jgi:hypothetical protein
MVAEIFFSASDKEVSELIENCKAWEVKKDE